MTTNIVIYSENNKMKDIKELSILSVKILAVIFVAVSVFYAINNVVFVDAIEIDFSNETQRTDFINSYVQNIKQTINNGVEL